MYKALFKNTYIHSFILCPHTSKKLMARCHFRKFKLQLPRGQDRHPLIFSKKESSPLFSPCVWTRPGCPIPVYVLRPMWIIGHSIEWPVIVYNNQKCWGLYTIAGDSIECTFILVNVGNLSISLIFHHIARSMWSILNLFHIDQATLGNVGNKWLLLFDVVSLPS